MNVLTLYRALPPSLNRAVQLVTHVLSNPLMQLSTIETNKKQAMVFQALQKGNDALKQLQAQVGHRRWPRIPPLLCPAGRPCSRCMATACTGVAELVNTSSGLVHSDKNLCGPCIQLKDLQGLLDDTCLGN